MKILLSFFACFSVIMAFANDGAYYLSGNQLIPIQETDISIKKEILLVKRINADHVQVTVSYLFDNPSAEKNLLVGFEAASPAGDADWSPKNGQHPYMNNFTVTMNGIPLKHTPSIVLDSNYYTSGQIQAATEQEILKEFSDSDFASFYYVYHFNALFKKGLNSIQHTYNFLLSGSVMEYYAFNYILTAANRWANNGIDDFTLIIDMGDFQDFLIEKNFFNQPAEWLMNGKVINTAKNDQPSYDLYPHSAHFFTHYGPIIFSQLNFHPTGELNLYSIRDYNLMDVTAFDASQHQLPYNLDAVSELVKSADELSFKILRNLPYARRGFVFKTPEIQAYYEKQKWYSPIPSYVSTENDLTEQETKWVAQVNANKF